MKEQIRDVFLHENAIRKGFWMNGFEGEGEFRIWYSNGVLYRICHYKDGRRERSLVDYYSNGKILKICSFINGRVEGEVKQWNRDGMPTEHSWFKNDHRIVDFLEHPELKKDYL